MSNEERIDKIRQEVFFISLANQARKKDILSQVTSNELLSILYAISEGTLHELYERHPDILNEFDESELKQLVATFHEAVGLASYIYYVDKCEIEGKKIALPSGEDFKKAIIKDLDDYFTKNTKSEDDLIPKHIFEVIKSEQLILLKGLDLIKSFKNISQKAREGIVMQHWWVVLMSYGGYVLQEKYAELENGR